jgi:hypothetical protein
MDKIPFNRKTLLKTLILFCILTGLTFPQLSSKITGTITDTETGENLYGVNVILKGTILGAATDENGKYFIINVPVGSYEVKASMIGYNSQTFTNVLISADRVTSLDFQLSSTVLQAEDVVVVAQRNILYKEVSSTQLIVTQAQVDNTAGIRDITKFLERQPGVTTNNGFIEIRGGSADQTGTYINGLSYNNAAVGNAETIVPLSAIDQVSLLSGGFNAEYGNFRSGLINLTTKSGTSDGYHGSVNIQRNLEHVKRFGPLLSDPFGPELAPFLDASVAFEGNADLGFTGWNDLTETFNLGRDSSEWATPLDYYLLGAWMQMATPDYEGLEKLGYTVSDEQKKLFEEHARDEEGVDYNIDLGFGGPLPFIGKALGDATFFLSHVTKGANYIVPFERNLQETYVTLATIKSRPSKSISLNLNGMWKRQLGLSPLKPAFGDSPDAGREGGFMPTNNLKYVADIASRDGGINYWFDPPIFPLLNQTTWMAGIDMNYVLNPSTFFDFSGSYSSITDDAPVGDNRNNTVLTNFGPFPVSEMPYGKLQFAPDNSLTLITGTDTISYTYPNYDAITGISKRFRGKEGDLNTNVQTQQANFKFDVVSQIGDHNYLKSGIEYIRIDINHLMWLKWNRTGPYNSYEYNYHRVPSQTGFYAQDQITYNGIIANLGVRLDYYYGGGGLWPSGDDFAYAFTSAFGGAPRNPGAAADSFYAILASGTSIIWQKWEEYNQENPGFLQPIENHFIVSPRLGLAFPVTEDSKFYFNYGHFRSNPPYYTMYLYRYRYDKNGLYEMSNPNLSPPQTISYELGFVYDFGVSVIGTLSGYYKDATGQTGDVNYINVNGTVDYDRWENNNYEDIEGLEINITKNDNSWITGWINYNYLLKKSGLTGNARISDVPLNEQEAFYQGQEDRFLPQPRLDANITFHTPDYSTSEVWTDHLLSSWRFTIYGEWKSGEYFTYNPTNNLYLSNNLQWPDYYMVDLKISKSFDIVGLNTTFYVDISNVFNFKVNWLYEGYGFRRDSNDEGDFVQWTDAENYFASLHLPMYASSEYDEKRAQNPGLYIPGDDKPGELKSADKPYINDPDYTYFIYGEPRDIWFGIKVDF